MDAGPVSGNTLVMAAAARDRVTIDLCGIGDAVRSAACAQGSTVAVFARQALITALPAGGAGLPPVVHHAPVGAKGKKLKLSVRLSVEDSAELALQAMVLGMSQARVMSLLIRRAQLPVPDKTRRAELAQLQSSNDRLAAIGADLVVFISWLARPDSAKLAPLRERMQTLEADIARHLDLAAAFVARRA